jgi:septal ring factor EnvC (AmiA/AmiB activator)
VTDPTETWRAALGQSTSAQLRQTQRDLAASQEDLSSVEAERDRFRENYVRVAAQLDEASDCLARIEVERDDARAERDALAVLKIELTVEAATWRAAAERYLTSRDKAAEALATANYQNQLLTAEKEADRG